MKIKKTKKSLIIEIPLWQTEYDWARQPVGKIDNIIAVIHEGTCSINQLIEMGYCGKAPQIGNEIVTFDMEVEDFKKECASVSLNLYKYPICSKCKKAIYGCFTYDDNMKPVHEDCLK